MTIICHQQSINGLSKSRLPSHGTTTKSRKRMTNSKKLQFGDHALIAAAIVLATHHRLFCRERFYVLRRDFFMVGSEKMRREKNGSAK
jgi:hypothetical protein